MTKLARLAVWAFRITAALTYLYHFLYWPLANSYFLEGEVFLKKWPWLVVGFGLVVVSEAIDLKLQERR